MQIIKKGINKYKEMPVQVKAAFWFLICSFLQKGISVLTTPIFTRLLTRAEYGKYGVFYSWLGIVTIFVTLNMFSGGFTRGLVKHSEEKDIYASSMQGLNLTLCLCWTAIYFINVEFWNKLFSLTTVQMTLMLIMVWTSSVFNYWACVQRVNYNYKLLVGVSVAVSVAKPIVGVIFVVLADDKVTARILGLALCEIMGYTGLFFLQMRKGKVFFSFQFWKAAILFNLPLIPHYLSQTVLNSSDKIMISNIIGDNEAGIYNLAYSISLIMTLFNTALSQTMSPWMFQRIKDKRTEEIAPIAYTTIIIVCVVNLALIVVAPEVVLLFAPKTYYDAIWVIPPVAMSVVFMFSYDLFARFEFYYAKTVWVMSSSVAGATLNVILNYIYINKYGYFAAGYTTLICYVFYAALHYFFMRRICKKYNDGNMVYDFRILALIYTVFLVMGFGLLLTYNLPVVRYLIVVVGMVLLIIYRKKIITLMKRILALKQTK